MNIKFIQHKYAGQIPVKDIRLILQNVLGFSAIDFVTQSERELNETELKMLNAIIQKRLGGMPVARIFEEWEFWGLPFHISPDTLVPRPDTETLIDAAISHLPTPPKTILDLGTGSGCILVALLSEYKDAFGVGVDISDSALMTARRNAVRNNVKNRCEFICADWSQAITGKFDLIVSNPPYIETDVIESLEPEVKAHDPILALDGGTDGLCAYRLILEQIKDCFTPVTRAFFEIGFDQGDSMRGLLEHHDYHLHHIHLDLAGQTRVVEFSRSAKDIDMSERPSGDKNKKDESRG